MENCDIMYKEEKRLPVHNVQQILQCVSLEDGCRPFF